MHGDMFKKHCFADLPALQFFQLLDPKNEHQSVHFKDITLTYFIHDLFKIYQKDVTLNKICAQGSEHLINAIHFKTEKMKR